MTMGRSVDKCCGTSTNTRVPACIVIVLMLTRIVGCGDSGDEEPAGPNGPPLAWIDDVAEEKRDETVRRMRKEDSEFYKRVGARSDVLSIATNAWAAVEMLAQTERGRWPEAPIAVAAVLLRSTGGPNKAVLMTDVCDLTRQAKSHYIYVKLPRGVGRVLEIQLNDVDGQEEPILKYSIGHSHRVVIAPLEEVVKDASPADANGVRRVVIEACSESEGHVLLPDPSEAEMAFVAVNRAGRRSNSVPVCAFERAPGAEARGGLIIFERPLRDPPVVLWKKRKQ